MTRIISKIPILGGVWDGLLKRPFVRHFIEEVKLAVRYRRLYPDSVQLPNSQSPIFVDRCDSRGRSVLLCGANGQPNLKVLWHNAVAIVQPDIVLDIGANYGEFVFGERYPTAERVLSIEANLALAPFLQKSHQMHPDREKILMLTALAAESSNEESEFFVDQGSSGRSTAVRRTDTVCKTTRIRTVAVDDLLSDITLEDMKVLFKIDVEGYEPVVFRGMRNLIDRSKFVIGIMEFNPTLIKLSGVEPESFLEELHSKLNIIALPHRHPPRALRYGTMAEIASIEGRDDFEIDLLVSTRTIAGTPEQQLIDQILG